MVTMSRNLKSQRDAEHGSTNREAKLAWGWARMCARAFATVFTPVIRVSGDKWSDSMKSSAPSSMGTNRLLSESIMAKWPWSDNVEKTLLNSALLVWDHTGGLSSLWSWRIWRVWGHCSEQLQLDMAFTSFIQEVNEEQS